MSRNRKSGRTSTAAKKRYHDKVYTDLNVALPHALYRQFRAKCRADGVSMRSRLIELLFCELDIRSNAELQARQAALDARLFMQAAERIKQYHP